MRSPLRSTLCVLSILLGFSAAQARQFELEPNNSAVTATAISGNAGVIRGRISPATDEDYYAFQAQAGDRVYAATMTQRVFSGSKDTVLTLLDTDGTTVLEANDNAGAQANGASAIAGATLDEAGTYYLRITGKGAAEIHNYDLYLQLRSGTPDTGSGTTLPTSGWVSGSAAQFQSRYYEFQLNAGDTVFIAADGDPNRTGSTANPYLTFTNSAGTVSQTIDGNTVSSAEVFMGTVREGGTYRIDLLNGGTFAAWIFNLSVTVIPASGTGSGYTNSTVVPIPDLGSATSSISVNEPAPIHKRIRVSLNLEHPRTADLKVTLTSPFGNTSLLLESIATGDDVGKIDVLLDDEAALSLLPHPSSGLVYSPGSGRSLQAFDGMQSSGQWTLTVTDTAGGETGELKSWSLEILPLDPLPPFTPQVIYEHDLVVNDGGFAHSGTPDPWQWGYPGTAPFNEGYLTKGWKTNIAGDLPSGSSSTLFSPQIDLSAVPANTTVLFRWGMKYQFTTAAETSFIVAVEEVGGSGQIVPVYIWMDGTMQTAGELVEESGGLSRRIAEISQFAGKVIRLRWDVSTSSANPLGGVQINQVSVTAYAPPDIAVIDDATNTSLTSGDTTPSTGEGTDFGSQGVNGGTATRTYRLSNEGAGTLNLSGDPRISITGPAAGDFTVNAQPSDTLAAGATVNFNITFDPSQDGLRTATVSIASNDPDESPFTFQIQGTGTRPTANYTIAMESEGHTLVWRVKLDQAVIGLNGGHFTTGLNGIPFSSLRFAQADDDGKEYTMTLVTTSGDGTCTLQFNNDNGVSHRLLGSSNAVSARVDWTAPTTPFGLETPITRWVSATGESVVEDYRYTYFLFQDPNEFTVTQDLPAGLVLGPGFYPITVVATDFAGNARTRYVMLSVRFQPPDAPGRVTDSAVAGTAAPGAGTTPGLASDAKLTTFFVPALDDLRNMAARVTITAAKKKLAGIYLVNGADEGNLPAFQGGSVPGADGQPLTGLTFKSFLDPVLSPNGALAFSATVAGAKSTEDQGVWTDAFGSLALVLREGHDVPGLPAGATLKSVTTLSLRDDHLIALVKLNAKKDVVTSGKDDVALIQLTDVNQGLALLRTNADFGGSKIKTIATLAPALGSPGQGRWHRDQGILTKVTLLNKDVQLVNVAVDGTKTSILSALAPATAIASDAKWKSFGVPAVGSPGTSAAVSATLLPKFGGVTTKDDVALLYWSQAEGWEAFAREGALTPISAAADAPRYATFFDPLANSHGMVAFLATVAGKTVTPKNKTALFAGPPDNLQVSARLGDFVPDADGQATTAVWTKFISHALIDIPGVHVLFLGETAGGDTTSKNKLGLWAIDQNGLRRRVLRTGIPTEQGGPLLTSMTLLTAVPGSYGTSRSFNETSSIAVLATFADKSQKLLRIDLP